MIREIETPELRADLGLSESWASKPACDARYRVNFFLGSKEARTGSHRPFRRATPGYRQAITAVFLYLACIFGKRKAERPAGAARWINTSP
jgi:hypothetical protein